MQKPFSYGSTRVVPTFTLDGFLRLDSNGHRITKIVPWTTDDQPYIYFGSGNKSGEVEVDAGLTYQATPSGKKYWRPFLNYHDRARDRRSLLLTPTRSGMVEQSLFDPGDSVSMNYWVRGATTTEKGTNRYHPEGSSRSGVSRGWP